MALSCVLARHGAAKPAPGSPLAHAAKLVDDLQQYALKLQNADGSWHPAYFAAVGSTTDALGQLRATGHMMQWLVVSLPKARLEEPAVVRGVEYLTTVLVNSQSQWYVPGLSADGIDAVTTATAALSCYDERIFKPLDPQKATEEAGTRPQRSRRWHPPARPPGLDPVTGDTVPADHWHCRNGLRLCATGSASASTTSIRPHDSTSACR